MPLHYLKIDPLEIPLNAAPGEAPLLEKELGHISFSHSRDALVIGWSQSKLGIDIERRDRVISARLIADRFFNSNDQEHIKTLTGQNLVSEVLNQWVIKESVIKWQRGSIASDLNKWNLDYKVNIARHNILNLQVNFYKIIFRSWIIAISSNQNIDEKNLIICID